MADSSNVPTHRDTLEGTQTKDDQQDYSYMVVRLDADGFDVADLDSVAEDRCVPVWRGGELIVNRIRKLQSQFLQGKKASTRMVRVQVRVGGCDVEQAMLWLRAQVSYPKTFFLNEDNSLLSAGCGSADTICGDGELKEALVRDDMPPSFRYYGGGRFDAGAAVAKEWAAFGGHYFVLPKIELLSEGGAPAEPRANSRRGKGGEQSTASWHCGEREKVKGFTLAVNMKAEGEGDWEEECNATVAAVEGMESFGRERTLPRPCKKWEGTQYDTWKKMIDEALAQMQDGHLRKVVLSRNYFVQFSSDVEPLDLLLKLRTHHGYLFLLQPARGSAFLGCSPEPLFRISHDVIETMAISGTRPRGDTQSRDRDLAEELLASQKDMYENGVTTNYIQQLLGEVAQDVETSEVYVMKLRHVQHICRKIRARPAVKGGKGTTPRELLLALNPTPAVCGESRPAATKFIRKSEGYDRGFFGGPVGFLSSKACEFLVAIRSVLCEPRMLHVYAGAGIVPGSDAESEWTETQLKMQNILQVVDKPAVPLRDLPNINVLPSPPPSALLTCNPSSCGGPVLASIGTRQTKAHVCS